MALINRLSRLFRADVHAVLDSLEEPEILLRQAIREMDEELAKDERRAKLMEREHELLMARSGELERALSDLEDELTVCFDSDKPDLARATIRRRLETQRLIQAIDARRSTLKQDLDDLRSRQAENSARLNDMRQKAELLSEDDEDKRCEEAWGLSDAAIRDEDVEVAFLREQRKRSTA